MTAISVVASARALVGCRYRPQGRDPLTGLDCVGVVFSVFGLSADAAPRNYKARSFRFREAVDLIAAHFLKVAEDGPGDLLLMAPSRDQLHLAVATDRGFVHADAGLRKVVETPGQPSWPVVGRYGRRPIQTD